jgi:hypothetical protein
MYCIAFGSENPDVQWLIEAYNRCEPLADEYGLEIILDKAKGLLEVERRKDSVDEVLCQELATIAGMCRMALAQLDFQLAADCEGRPEVRAAAEHMLACVTSMLPLEET